MAVIALGRWGALRALKSPLAWVGALVLVALVPLLARLTPFAHADIEAAGSLARSWIVPVGLLAVAATLGFLARAEPVLERLAPRTRLLGEVGLLWTAPLVPWLLLGVGAAWAGAPRIDVQVLVALTALAVHLAGLALLALRLPTSPGLRVVALLGAAWALPALLNVHLAGRAFDVARTFEEVPGGIRGASAFILPLGVLLVAVCLPPTPSRSAAH